MKIVTILGARPQFIKAAAVSRELQKYHDIEEIIIHTGQHYDKNMSEIFFEEMEIPRPTYNLDINGLSQGAMTGRMMEKIESLLLKILPDMVLVYGDTNSTLAGALTARKLNIPIAHVEGGLRNFDLSIPEDVNRILTDRISDIIFYSTHTAGKILQEEGYENFPVKLVKTGDLMADTVKHYSKQLESRSNIVTDMQLDNQDFILLTVHRQSNINKANMSEIINALNEISEETPIIFPIHPNTKSFIEKNDLHLSPHIKTIAPVGYFDMLQLLQYCTFVITDSGGLQREAYLMQTKSLLLMEYTPWEELVAHSFSKTTPILKEDIIENFNIMKAIKPDFTVNLYGNGESAAQIVEELVNFKGRDVFKL